MHINQLQQQSSICTCHIPHNTWTLYCGYCITMKLGLSIIRRNAKLKKSMPSFRIIYVKKFMVLYVMPKDLFKSYNLRNILYQMRYCGYIWVEEMHLKNHYDLVKLRLPQSFILNFPTEHWSTDKYYHSIHTAVEVYFDLRSLRSHYDYRMKKMLSINKWMLEKK